MTGCYTAYNEDMAIVKLQPWVHKEDFADLESALRTFFEEMHQIRVADIQPCPLGDAFVHFNSPLEREKFLGPEFSFGSYSMKVIKHDDGDNARSYDLDRDAWVMILAFPEDLKIRITIAKAISGFGILVDWHDNLAPVVAKVYLNEFAKIQSSVKVNAGLPQKGRSWTLACYVLKKSNLVSPPDEEAFVTHGPLHLVPPQPPHWFGFVQPAGYESTPSAPLVGSVMKTDGGFSRWEQQVAPHDLVPFSHQPANIQSEIQRGKRSVGQNTSQGKDPSTAKPPMVVPAPSLKSIIIGPTAPRDPNDPLVTVVPSILKKVLTLLSVQPHQYSFRNLTCLAVDHDIIIPSYFNDPHLLAHLACILYP